MAMPKFGGVFSNEGKGEGKAEGKGAGHDMSERRGGLSGEEVTSRLYPKATDTWRKDEAVRPEPVRVETAIVKPVAVAARSEPAGIAPTPPAEPAEMETSSERSGPVAGVESGGNGRASTVLEPASLAMVPSPPAEAAPLPPAAMAEAPAERLVSVISRNSVFDGNYSTDGDVRVEGEVRGDITCKGHVLICDGAAVSAKITATSVSVAGRLSGEVTCAERFEAQPTARITSQISTPRLVIQEGAVVDGQIRMGVQE
jgi:cytoskeletal protein CcmA (bactofilin family)